MAKVLIIEDEKAMSDLIAIKFKVEGFEVDQAFSLSEAKQKLTSPGVTYDAILSDYLLPDGNSLDLFTEVRTQPQVANVPIVLATNYVEDLSQDKAKQLGISEVIVKYQVVPAQMVEKVKHLIQVQAGQAGGQPQAATTPNVAPAPTPAAQPVTPPTAPAVPPAVNQASPAVQTPPPVVPEQPIGQFQATPPGVAPTPPPVTPAPEVVSAPQPSTPVVDPTKPQ